MSLSSVVCASTIRWSVEAPASLLLLTRVADAAGQRITDEALEVEGAEVEEHQQPDGTRPLRLHASADAIVVRYTATVDLEASAPPDPTTPLAPFAELDLELLTYTLPSRYCPSDVLAATARDLFGHLPRTAALLEEVRSWVEDHIDYVIGSSDAHTAADETLLRRTGVCRDLAHLTTGLLRALGVPARMVGAYALDLDPPDFHALIEAHDGLGWRRLDATGLAPVATTTRIATGRDAAEIAWATDDGGLTLDELTVTVERAG